MGAFLTSCLPHQIIKWVASQTGIEGTKKPDVNTPQVVLGGYSFLFMLLHILLFWFRKKNPFMIRTYYVHRVACES